MKIEEFTENPWLNLLGSSRYIILITNPAGKVLWAANRRNHRYREIIQTFFEGQLQDFYHMEGVGKIPPPSLPEVDPGVHFSLDRLVDYNSKNIFESGFLTGVETLYPLTHLHLGQIDGGHHLAIISFSEAIELLKHAREKQFVMTDPEGRITAFSTRIAETLRRAGQAPALGAHVKQYLAFDSDPLQFPEGPAPGNGETLLHWQGTPETLALKKTGAASAILQGDAGRLRWRNLSENTYSYVDLPVTLELSDHDFSLEITYAMAESGTPLVAWGVSGAAGNPDATGYLLTRTPGLPLLTLKRQSEAVRHLPFTPPDPKEPAHLRIEKRRETFAFFVNGVLLGSWRAAAQTFLPGQNRICLALRPLENIDLFSLRLSRLPAGKTVPEEVKRTARAALAPDRFSFRLNLEQGVMGFTNYNAFYLEDVSDLSQQIETLRRERDRLDAALPVDPGIIGQSPAMLKIKSDLLTYAGSDLSVLIEGETGTGKEVLARQIHEASTRKKFPFVKLDCAALPAGLIESELFGHVKGAFTGALKDYGGRIAQAHRGTLFLDEIENLPVETQAKLLAVLQDGNIHPVGAERPVGVDFRLIAASNRPLTELMRGGRFRSDFYYRLNQIQIALPPLSKRVEDIPLLAARFLNEGNRLYGKGLTGFTEALMRWLVGAPWPGNIRELRNVILRGVVFAGNEKLDIGDLRADAAAPGERAAQPGALPGSAPRKRKPGRRNLSGETVARTLEECGGNVSKCAARLNTSRMNVYRKLKKTGVAVRPEVPRSAPR